MVSISYFVRSGTNTIYFSVSKGREFQIKRSTQKKLNNSSNWIAEKHKVSQCKQEPFANSINNYLANHKSNIVKEIQELQKNQLEVNEVNVSMILNTFEDSTISKRKRYEFSFTKHLEDFVELMRKGKKTNVSTGKVYSKNTIKGYNSLIESIKNYEKENGDIKPHKVDYQLYLDMVDHFKTNTNYKDSYIGAMIKRFKATISNYLQLDLGIHFKNYNPTQWKKIAGEETLKTYLSLSELNTLLKLDLSGYDKEYDSIRDAYCFIAFTCGLRIGDYMQLKKHNITTKMVNGKKIQYIEFKQSKNDGGVKAPLNKIALELLKKHNGFPSIISEAKSLKVLKKLGKICGFDEWCYLEDSKGNILEKKRKYELITNHSARMSFCTNAWDMKTDIVQIMKMSGHKTPEILLGYIGKSLDEYADRMLETDYFNIVNDLDNSLELKAV